MFIKHAFFLWILVAGISSMTPMVDCEFNAETKTFHIIQPSGKELVFDVPQDEKEIAS